MNDGRVLAGGSGWGDSGCSPGCEAHFTPSKRSPCQGFRSSCYRPVSWPQLARKSRNPFDLTRHYYLKRASWNCQVELKMHALALCPEHKHRYARPCEWTWTNHKLRFWSHKHTL